MHGQHFILLSFRSSLGHLPLLLETYRSQLCGIPLQILGNVKHLVDNTIHFLENIKRTEPLKMCFHEQDPKPNPVGRWAGQSVRSSHVTYWPFLRRGLQPRLQSSVESRRSQETKNMGKPQVCRKLTVFFLDSP